MTCCETCAVAAEKGHLKCLKELRAAGNGWDEETTNHAALKGNLEILSYAHENGCPFSSKICLSAAYSDQLPCLEYVRNHGAQWDCASFIYDVAFCEFPIIKYAIDNLCIITPWMSTLAGKSLEILSYAREKGGIWTNGTFEEAIMWDKFDCFVYAHKNGCPWNASVTACAAKQGRLKFLKYARENGCPWDSRVYEGAVHHYDDACLKYAWINNCPIDNNFNAAVMAAKFGSIDCMRFAFRRMKCRPSLEVSFWAAQHHWLCLQLAREMGCPWDATVTLAAATAGQEITFSYAVGEGCPFNDEECRTAAYRQNLLEIVYILNDRKWTKKLQEKKVVEESEAAAPLPICTICAVEKKCIAFDPCGHIVACLSCSDRLSQCAYCRASIARKLKVFLV